MLQHIVMWKVKDEALGMDRPALAKELKKRLEGLVGQVPEIRAFVLGINTIPGDTAHDVVLQSSFDDVAALERYMKHPQHLEVVAYLKQIVAERRAVDYTD